MRAESAIGDPTRDRSTFLLIERLTLSFHRSGGAKSHTNTPRRAQYAFVKSEFQETLKLIRVPDEE